MNINPQKKITGNKYRIKYQLIRVIPVTFLLINLLFFNTGVMSQRVIDYDQFSEAYFDSIRVTVYDTAKEHYTIKAYRLSEAQDIIIDGKLDEQAWYEAEHAGNLLEKEPYPLIKMSEETEFAILHDSENLYIGVWCWDSEPEKIIPQVSPRGTSAPDNLMIFIDSYHDHRTGYKFGVSPTGVQNDELRYDDIKRDGNWNGVWYSEGSIDDKGWYAEIKIPFFNFRYSKEENQTWGFNIMRNIAKDGSRGQWKPHLPEWDNTTRMSQNGHIEGISGITSGRTLEIRPYSVLSSTEMAGIDPRRRINFGGDLRYSPTPNLTADFTFNPDFAQVDADVFEINLTRFPTRFQELRPFFTERINVFNTPLELFYSRRIGSRGDILGGVKMTGKLKHGVEFGIIGNMTGDAFFSNSLRTNEDALFGVMRVKKDIMGSSSIGILAATKEESGNYNRIMGVDGSFLLSKNDIFDCQIATGQTELQHDQNMAYNMAYIRTGDLMGMQLNFERIEPAFEINRIGYIQKEPDRGWNKGTGTFRVSPRINKYGIRRVITNIKYEHINDMFTSDYINRWLLLYPGFTPDTEFGNVIANDQGERSVFGGTRSANNYTAGGDVTVNLINEMSFLAEYRHFSATELTGHYSGNIYKMSYSTRPLRLGTKFAGIFATSGGTYYNFTQKYVGSQRNLTIDGEGRLHHKIITKLQGGYTKTFDNSGSNDGRYFKLSSNTTWMFTKDFFFRLHAQGMFGTTWYDQKEMYNDYLLSCLISWEYRPGSFLYLAYNESRFDESGPLNSRYFSFNDRTIVLKVSYFFSI